MRWNGRAAAILRAGGVMGVLMLALARWPDAALRPWSGPLGAVAGWLAPHLRAVDPEFVAGAMKVRGVIELDLVLVDGSPLPPVAGSWRRSSGMLSAMAVVGLSLWAAPAMGRRRRLAALPIVVVGLVLAGGLWLSVDLQVAALGEIGQGWLATQPLAPSEANRAAFSALERWYRAMEGGKTFLDGGGALMLAALAGLSGRGVLGRGEREAVSTRKPELKEPRMNTDAHG